VAGLLAGPEAPRPQVTACTAHTLEDPAVQYTRAAQTVMMSPESLEGQLCRLLEAEPHDDGPGMHHLVFDDGEGPPVMLQRALAFTDTEIARASAVRKVAAAVGRSSLPAALTEPDESGPAVIRPGTKDDVDLLIAMHARCSAESIYRRYHSFTPHHTRRFAESVLQPTRGWSLVMTSGPDIVAVAVLGVDGDGHSEVGLLVEDRWQRRGLGSRLLRAVADEASAQGVQTLMLLVQRENEAVLPAVRRAGFNAHVASVDGLLEVSVPIGRLAEERAHGRGRVTMGKVTTPLVELLNRRSELREIYPAAGLLDQSVRGGA
jgi:GNAT superfamily N-acetyltransferase